VSALIKENDKNLLPIYTTKKDGKVDDINVFVSTSRKPSDFEDRIRMLCPGLRAKYERGRFYASNAVWDGYWVYTNTRAEKEVVRYKELSEI
jgi:hypothetical protein